jgi:hypothetical protein
LVPYSSFEELVGPEYPDLAEELQRLYGDIEAVEFVPGVYLEKVEGGGLDWADAGWIVIRWPT